MIKSFHFVDYVTTDEITPKKLIEKFFDILVKAGDYKENDVVGDIVKNNGGNENTTLS